MGFLSKALDWITGKGSSIVSAGIGAVSSAIQNKKNRDWNADQAEINRQFQSEEAETARQFNAHEAALQRDWSSQEAERARDWNEEMYEKYNSLSGKIHQAELAGVNPMFAVTGNAVSPMSASASAPSGASASGGAPSGSSATSSFVDLVGSMLGMAKLKSEIENIKADTDLKDSQKSRTVKETDWMDRLNEEKLKLSQTQRDNLDGQLKYLEAQANYISAIQEPDVKLKRAQALITEWQEKNKELFKGLEIGSDLLSTLANVGVSIVNAKAGLSMANRPLVVGKDAMVFHPSDIVH